MKIKMRTDDLQNAVVRVIKGVSNNKFLPLTSLMAIELKDDYLQFVTTDGTNYLYIKCDKSVIVDNDDSFYAVVNANIFSRLVSKFTSDFVTMEITKNNILRIIANGVYELELTLDESGNSVVYPDPINSYVDSVDITESIINLSTIKTILTTCKPSLATTYEVPCYTGYYIGDSVVATNSYKLASMAVKLFEEPKLIRSETMQLLDVMTAEKINVRIIGDDICFSTDDCIVYGKTLDGISDYQIVGITALIEMEFPSMCKLSKTLFVSLLERLTLFVSPYDNNSVYLKFTADGLQVTSKKANCSELIEYRESSNFKEFECCVDVEMLLSQIKAQVSDVVELWYGADNALKTVEGNITQVVALQKS